MLDPFSNFLSNIINNNIINNNNNNNNNNHYCVNNVNCCKLSITYGCLKCCLCLLMRINNVLHFNEI